MSTMMHDTTANHKNHLFDVNCSICSGLKKAAISGSDPRTKDNPPTAPPYAKYLGSPNSPLEAPIYPTSKSEHSTKHDVFGAPTSAFFSGRLVFSLNTANSNPQTSLVNCRSI